MIYNEQVQDKNRILINVLKEYKKESIQMYISSQIDHN